MPPSKPLPWHDTPRCRELNCGGTIIFDAVIGMAPSCDTCLASFRPTPEEAKQIRRAEEAWEGVLEGRYHGDRGCSRCGGVLPIDSERLCPKCVKADMSERNLTLF